MSVHFGGATYPPPPRLCVYICSASFIEGLRGVKGEPGDSSNMPGNSFPTGFIEGPPGPPGPPGSGGKKVK